MRKFISLRIYPVLIIVLVLLMAYGLSAQTGKKVLTFEDIMKFKEIRSEHISADGALVVYAAAPGRGDGQAYVHHVKSGKVFKIDRGQNPVIAKGARWVAVAVAPGTVETAMAKKEKPQKGMALLDTGSGNILNFEDITSFAFSADGAWLAYQHFKERPPKDKKPAEKTEAKAEQKPEEEPPGKPAEKPAKTGTRLVIRSLETGREKEIPDVDQYAFGDTLHLAYTVASADGASNGLYVVSLGSELKTTAVETLENGVFGPLVWAKERGLLAFTLSPGKKDGRFSKKDIRYAERARAQEARAGR